MPTIDIIAEFASAPDNRIGNVDAIELTTDLGEKILAVTLDDATALCDLWADGDTSTRGWTIPDNAGDYDGIVLADAGGWTEGVALAVWDAYDLAGTTIEGPLYRLDQFPYAIEIEAR